jgi:PAS domain S-box-containing protein
LSLRSYLVGLVALFIVAASTGAVYQRRAAGHHARDNTLTLTRFAAEMAARTIGGNLTDLRDGVNKSAANPAFVRVLEAPAGCALEFAGEGYFKVGHLDVVRPDGSVACSSMPTNVLDHRNAEWLSRALQEPTLSVPVTDARTGGQVLLATAPIAGKGILAAFLELRTMGPALAASLGGSDRLEFVVTSGDGATILARSIDSARWSGTSLAPSPFTPTSKRVDRLDVDGKPRLYGTATVGEAGWRVYAGANRSDALAVARRPGGLDLAVVILGVVVLVFAALVVHRRIARPIGELSAAIGAATAHSTTGPITVKGPAEIASLVDDFNSLIAAADRELEAKSRLAAIVESSGDAIIGADTEGVITSFNPGAERIFGQPAADFIGRSVATLHPQDRLDELPRILETIGRGDRIEVWQTRWQRPDRSIVDVDMTVSPIMDAAGTIIGGSAVGRDVTELKKAEEERRSLEHRLNQSQRLESLGQLAGGVAHDFNNLLAVILNYATFVEEETTGRADVQADVQQIRAAAERAARLTQQLLIFGRRQPVQSEVIDLNAIVADVHELLSRSIGEHVQLVFQPGDVPNTRVDRGQMEQVLLNLAVNARDAMLGGGTLTIATRSLDVDESFAELHPETRVGSYVELSVSDTGTGMSPEVKAHMFEPFFTTKPTGQGTGLGMATVYGIATEAGGTVSVYSELGIGTTIRICLPVADGPASSAPGRAVSAPGGSGETVLVVEDEPAMLEVASRILRRNGYGVIEAGTTEQALALAAVSSYDLLLTDCLMPHMSGRELVARIAQQRPDVPVLFMSGHSAGVLNSQQILDEGVALIQKPFTECELLEKVADVLARAVAPEPAG